MTKKKRHPDVPPRRSGRPIKVEVLRHVTEIYELVEGGAVLTDAIRQVVPRDTINPDEHAERELFKQYARWKPVLKDLYDSQCKGLNSELSSGVNLLHVVLSEYAYAVDLDMDDPRCWCPD